MNASKDERQHLQTNLQGNGTVKGNRDCKGIQGEEKTFLSLFKIIRDTRTGCSYLPMCIFQLAEIN